LIGSASAAALAGTEGSVVAGTDTGHPGAGALDPNFGFNPDGTFNSTLLTDFNERSVLELAVKTKALTQAYYQQPQKFAYFEGCSTGGRQGYYMLQNHPEHYNGYILGAPSFSWFKFVTSADLYPQVVIQRELGGVPLTAAQRNLVNGQAVSTCDVVGGQHLGFVLDPEQCKYDPTRDATVLCAGTTGAGGVVGTNSTAACVTPVQAQTMNKLWYGATADGSVPDPQ
jgi:feruloyl esterase